VLALSERNDVNDYLDTHGWKTVAVGTSELFLANGLEPILEQEDERAPFAHRQLHRRHTAGAYVGAAMLIAKFLSAAAAATLSRRRHTTVSQCMGLTTTNPITTTRGAQDDQTSR
jgi:hypothetical protein